MEPRLKAISAGMSLMIPACVGMFSAGVPTLYCPFPLITTFPLFILHFPLGPLVPVILFFLWNRGLLHQQAIVPKRTVAAAVLLSSLTVAYFAFAWNDGVAFQGARYTLIIFIINLAWLALLWFFIIRCWRQPSFTTNLVLHWLLFAWMGWYAFPYLGELP